MTTLAGRPNTALLVVDVQNGVVETAHERDAVVGNIAGLVERARREQVPVVWVQDHGDGLPRGSDQWRIVPELDPSDAEPLVHKVYGDAFEDTDLEFVLSATSASGACSSSARRPTPAFAQRCTARSPGDTTRPWSATRTPPRTTPQYGAPPPDMVIAHTNLYWKYQTAPGRTAGTVATRDVDFSSAR